MIRPGKKMRKIALVTIFLFMSCFSYAQFIGNKINLYVGFNSGSFLGKGMTEENSFISPSLYSNYNSLKGLSFKGLIKKHQVYSLGLAFDFLRASNWKHTNYVDYLNSSVRLYSFSPTFQLHNKFLETGISNRLKVFLEVAPTVGLSKLALNRQLFDISRNKIPVSHPMGSNEFFFGVKGGAGLEAIVNKVIGVQVSYSLQHNRISSTLFHEKGFTTSGFNCGFFVRLKKNKRFFY